MRNKKETKLKLSLQCSLIILALASVGCQTTRRPSAIRSADQSTLLVQVSQDPASLMWNNSAAGEQLNSSPKTTEIQSQDPNTLQMRAEISLLGHMTRAATDNARAILRRDLRNVKAIKTLIKSSLSENKAHEAIALIESAKALAPQDADIYSFEGLAQYQLENPVFTKALWTKALSLDPLHIPTLMNLAVLLFQNGHTQKAGAHFDRVLAIQPQHLDAQVGRALVMSAEGDHERAILVLEGLLKKTGDNALILNNLAQISRERLKDFKRASNYVERMLALEKTDRRSIEAAIGMKQELRRLMASQEKRLSDESVREIAAGSEPNISEKAAPEANSTAGELQRMEDNIK